MNKNCYKYLYFIINIYILMHSNLNYNKILR